MTEDMKVALQVAIFGLVVYSRLMMGSHIVSKRIKGFLSSSFCGLLWATLMYISGMYILVAMEIVLMSIDFRSGLNNWRKGSCQKEANQDLLK